MILSLLGACTGDTSSPREVNWERDGCERCGMVLSDRRNSAQIRYHPPGGQRSKVAVFDDFGCAVLWLQDKPWKDDPETEFWVTDQRSGEWINAHQATYLPGQKTPMEYGLGAQLDWQEGGLGFARASDYVSGIEQRLNARGTQLLDRYREQAVRREAHRQQHQEDTELPSIAPLKE